MLHISGQTAGPIGLTFFYGHSWVEPGGIFFSNVKIKFFSQATLCSSASSSKYRVFQMVCLF